MAWYCSGSSNTELIENLYNAGLIKNERVKKAMLGVSSSLRFLCWFIFIIYLSTL